MTNHVCRCMRVLGVMAGLFAAASLLPIGTQAAFGADINALIGEGNGNIDLLNITAGTHTTLTNDSALIDGLAYNANETVLYGVTSASLGGPTTLVTINQKTGVDTTIGVNGTGVALSTLTNLANGSLWGVDYNTGDLYEVNPSNGATTLIGSTGLGGLDGVSSGGNSLASDGTNLFYTFGANSPSSLFKLSTTTGASTLIGATGVTGIIGSAFAGPTFISGQLYGFTSDGSTYLINTSTGDATLLNSNGIEDIFGGVGIITAVATPAVPLPPAAWSALSLLAGLAGIAAIRRFTQRDHSSVPVS